MSRPWNQAEIDWALECLSAGDSIDEVAEWAGRAPTDVAAAFAHLTPMSARQREIASLAAAGVCNAAIEAMVGLRPAGGDITRTLRRLRARGYEIAMRSDERMYGAEIDALVARHQLETRRELARKLGLSPKTAGSWNIRGLSKRHVEVALHG